MHDFHSHKMSLTCVGIKHKNVILISRYKMISGRVPLHKWFQHLHPRWLDWRRTQNCIFKIFKYSGITYPRVKGQDILYYTAKNVWLVQGSWEQDAIMLFAHIVHKHSQQHCSALSSLNQPAIRCINAEQYCWQLWTIWATEHSVVTCFYQPRTSHNFYACRHLATTFENILHRP